MKNEWAERCPSRKEHFEEHYTMISSFFKSNESFVYCSIVAVEDC